MDFNILRPEEEAIARGYNGIPAWQLLAKVIDACHCDDSVLHQIEFEHPSDRPDSVCCITRSNGYAIRECRFVDRKGPVTETREYGDAYHFLYALHIILSGYGLHLFKEIEESK